MQNIKNFKVTEPTPEQQKKFTDLDGSVPVFYRSEDGQDWYECQASFADDTIKIMYDSKGIICSVVDAPVPERQNIYAVSMFSPENMSVAEIPVSKYPEGVSIDGSWAFNGVDIVPYQPTRQEQIAIAEATKSRLMDSASQVIAPLQDAVDFGEATDEETARLLAWKKYRIKLSRVDVRKPEWPSTPV